MKLRALDDMVLAILKNAVVIALACAPIAAVAQQPGRYEGGRTVQVVTTVQAISQGDRRVTLAGKDGTRLIVEAGPAVTNLSEVKPGDEVVVIYQEGIIAEVKPRGQGVPAAKPSTGSASSDHAPTATTARIDAVDISTHTVTFTRPDGQTRRMAVMRPDAQRFIEKLKPGDEVQVTYREAVALSIEPNRR